MIEYIDYLIKFLVNLQTVYQVIIITLLYLVGPILLIPIMGVSYLAGFFFGFNFGVVFSILGYTVSTYIYYKFGNIIHNIDFIKRKIVYSKKKYKALYVDINFFGIVFLSLSIPFLPLIIMLGALKKRKRIVISGIVVGALPMTLISVYLGSVGKSFLETKDTKLVVLIVFGFIVIYLVNKIISKYLKKRDYEKGI